MESTKNGNGKLLGGMTGFFLIAVGQALSLIGSGMTNFAIVIWAWEMTGQATTLALAGFFGFAPMVLMSEAGRQSRGSIWKEAAFGFKYIWARPSLFWLQMVFFTINLTATFGFTVVTPMILARTGNDATTLGVVQSFAAAGGIGGGLLLSVWGGPKRRIHGVLTGMILAAISQQMLMGIGKQAAIWAIAGFFGALFIPILNGSNQAIWQAKVEPDLQGRVFSVRRLIAQITAPIAMLMAGPLADKIFEPAMSSGSVMSSTFGWLVGTGPGSGMALMLVIAGVLGVLVGLGGYMFPIVRNVETILPDYDEKLAPAISPEKQQRLDELLDARQALLSQAPTTDRDQALKDVSQELRTLGQS